jgi:predicted dehydrogenase
LKKVRVGIIGLGKMGILHTALVNVISEAELAALHDIDKKLSKYVKNSGLNVPFYSDLDKMLKENDLNAVFICTPTFTHFPIAEKCAEYKLAMFTEKPLAESYESAKKMVKLAENNNFTNLIGFPFLHVSLFKKAKKMLEETVLGEIFRVRSSIYISQVFGKKKGWFFDKRKSGGGVIIDIASHLLSLLYWYFGPIKNLFARVKSIYSNVEDSGSVIFEFTNGIIGTLDTSWSVPGYRLSYIEIFVEGSNGVMELTNDYIKINLYRDTKNYKKGWTTIHKIDLGSSSPFELGGEGYYDEDKHFIDCCLAEQKSFASWKFGLEIQKIVEAIYLSSEENNFVDLNKIN